MCNKIHDNNIISMILYNFFKVVKDLSAKLFMAEQDLKFYKISHIE